VAAAAAAAAGVRERGVFFYFISISKGRGGGPIGGFVCVGVWGRGREKCAYFAKLFFK